MDEQAILATKRLRLVPFQERFLTERYVGWLNDPQVVQYSDQRFKRHTLDSCRAYTQSFQGSPHFLWAIESTSPALGHIGNICATLEPPHRVGDISILLGERSVWGKGVGFEAWSAVCRFLFHQAGLRKVTGGTLEVNQAMLRIMRKCGMQEEGRRLRQHLFQGRAVDIVYYGLFAEQPLCGGNDNQGKRIPF